MEHETFSSEQHKACQRFSEKQVAVRFNCYHQQLSMLIYLHTRGTWEASKAEQPKAKQWVKFRPPKMFSSLSHTFQKVFCRQNVFLVWFVWGRGTCCLSLVLEWCVHPSLSQWWWGQQNQHPIAGVFFWGSCSKKVISVTYTTRGQWRPYTYSKKQLF